MKNDFFHIKHLNEQLQIRNVPDELFSETFLLNYEENRILLRGTWLKFSEIPVSL